MDTKAQLLEYLVFYVIAINFAAFAAVGIDKMLAEANAQRSSESRLLNRKSVG